MKVLGVSAFFHDSAAALVGDDGIIAAAQEERFTRRRHDAGFPEHAIRFCLEQGATSLADLDGIVFYEKPLPKFERLLDTYLSFAPAGFRSFNAAMPVWLREKLFQKRMLTRALDGLETAGAGTRPDLMFVEHHLSHAASAFYPSPFREAAMLTIDGVGEWATTTVGSARDSEIQILKEIRFPHSIGLLYSAFTYYLGFKVNSAEYKVMGLAPYGSPRFAQTILNEMVDLRADGSYRLDQSFFNYCAGLTMTSERFHALFGGPPRAATAELTQREFDIAASVQAVTEEIVLRLGKFAAKQTGSENLCLAGGVALNCVANSKLLKAGVFRNIWIQPAAGDAGGALGAALVAANSMNGGKRFTPPSKDAMKGALLGPSYSDNDVRQRLARIGASFEEISDETDLIRRTVDQLVHGSAVGWFQGAMEFGPRALGSRSILADPRSPRIRALLNLKVKHRESFRPFAASILRESLADWFDIDVDSPYMLLVGPVAADKRSAIPAVTHVDYSTRIQTVDAETNPLYYKLLTEFRNRTGVPLLVNTSFNVRGEPLVCTPEDAFRCFVGTELDALVAGNCFLLKSEQSPEHTMAPAATFAPD